ncbi:hypothetical protein B0H14DRAFT_2583054 [Mycena olivaceomarginata]|nr:hypothetical protein B0H14DRAFT_2583054 [Mycena olivaceomarginata]
MRSKVFPSPSFTKVTVGRLRTVFDTLLAEYVSFFPPPSTLCLRLTANTPQQEPLPRAVGRSRRGKWIASSSSWLPSGRADANWIASSSLWTRSRCACVSMHGGRHGNGGRGKSYIEEYDLFAINSSPEMQKKRCIWRDTFEQPRASLSINLVFALKNAQFGANLACLVIKKFGCLKRTGWESTIFPALEGPQLRTTAQSVKFCISAVRGQNKNDLTSASLQASVSSSLISDNSSTKAATVASAFSSDIKLFVSRLNLLDESSLGVAAEQPRMK